MGCCKPLETSDGKDAQIAAVFAALSNPARIQILRHIANHRHCGCKDITDTLPLAQSTVSQHLKVLQEVELITMEAVPPRSRYAVNEELLHSLSRSTSQFLNSCCKSARC